MADEFPAEIEDDMAGADVEAEQALMRERAERVRRRLATNVARPSPGQKPGPEGDKPAEAPGQEG